MCSECLSFWTPEPVVKDRASGSRVEYISLAWEIDVFPPLIRAAEEPPHKLSRVRTDGCVAQRPERTTPLPTAHGMEKANHSSGAISSYLHRPRDRTQDKILSPLSHILL